MSDTQSLQVCTLCGIKLPLRPVDAAFCCHGCSAVWNILKSQDALQRAKTHPLFQQAVESGIISNPELLASFQEKRGGEKIYLELGGLWCPSCALVIEYRLKKLPGILKVHADYSTDLAIITFEPMRIGKEEIIKVIVKLGYTASTLEESVPTTESWLPFWISAFFTLNIMMLSYPIYASFFSGGGEAMVTLFKQVACAFSLPVLVVSFPIFKRAWNALKIGFLGMEALVSIAALSAFTISLVHPTYVYYDAMSVVLTLVLLGKRLESHAKFSSRVALLKLARRLPQKGRGRDGNSILIKDVKIGNELFVMAGEGIALDGEVVEGSGNVDESVMTGEPLPIAKHEGDQLVSGSILQSGWIVYKVCAEQKVSTLQKIAQMVESAMVKRSRAERLVDRVAKCFTPLVLLIALFSRSLEVLLIACPCAIGIAVPLVESYVMAALAKLGAIVLNRDVLQTLGKEDHYVFDKTGTVTTGEFTVTAGLIEHIALKSLVVLSEHPISKSISKALSIKPQSIEMREIPGKGLEGWLDGVHYELLTAPEENGTALNFFADGTQLTTLYLQETIRDDIPKGLPDSILLSGDTPSATKRIADKIGFKKAYGGKTPLEKYTFIHGLNGVTAFVGDGINDAPALAASDIGIAVKNASEMTMCAADLSCDIYLLPEVRRRAVYGRKIAVQNLLWAFGYNTVGIALAAFGFLNPIIAAVAMVLSSGTIYLNSRRVR